MDQRVIKFRQWLGGTFLYWGINLDELRNFIGPGSQNLLHPGNNIHQQFTGLLDCEGKEIYEGDIVSQYQGEDWERHFKVEWNQPRCGFWLSLPNGHFHLDLTDFREKLRVIGNIFENPELLEANDGD